MSRRRTVGAGLIGAVAVALALAGAISAANPSSKEKIALTPAGKAQAKAEVLRRADLGAGWSGGFKKVNPAGAAMPCSNYRPKQSDLVLIGAAETNFQKAPFVIDDEAQVLKGPAMVRRDWQRTVVAPQVVPCLRQGFTKAMGSSGTLVSFGRVAFPRVATFTRAFRAVGSVKTGQGTVQIEIDFVALGAGRNEITLELSGPTAARTTLTHAERQMARLLARRLRS
jgi:hypothetical protein